MLSVRSLCHSFHPCMVLQDGQPGPGDGSVQAGNQGDHGNHGHVDIQQQILVTGDGVRMQVVRVVSFGAANEGRDEVSAQVHEQLKQLGEAVMGGLAGDEEGKAEEDEVKEVQEAENEKEKEEEEKEGEEKKKTDSEAPEKDQEEGDEEEKEDEDERSINPRGKVLLDKEEKESNEEAQEKPSDVLERKNATTSIEKHEKSLEKKTDFENDRDEAKEKLRVPNLDTNNDDTSTTTTKATKEPDKREKIKVKVFDVVTEESKDDSDEDYDVIQSKTKRIRIESVPNQARKSQDPPKSIFKNLGPSRQRYTILKDEL